MVSIKGTIGKLKKRSRGGKRRGNQIEDKQKLPFNKKLPRKNGPRKGREQRGRSWTRKKGGGEKGKRGKSMLAAHREEKYQGRSRDGKVRRKWGGTTLDLWCGKKKVQKSQVLDQNAPVRSVLGL